MTDRTRATKPMAELALELIGLYSQVQEGIDEVAARRFFDKRMPEAAGFVWNRTVKNIPDKERATLFCLLAKDLETDADLTKFKEVYSRVRIFRNSVAHCATFEQHSPNQATIRASLFDTHNSEPLEPLNITRSQLAAMKHECGWLHAQVRYVALASDLYLAVYVGSVLMQPVKPPQKPNDWDGRYLSPAASEG